MVLGEERNGLISSSCCEVEVTKSITNTRHSLLLVCSTGDALLFCMQCPGVPVWQSEQGSVLLTCEVSNYATLVA